MQIPVPAVAGVYTIWVRLLDSGETHVTRLEGELSGPAGQVRGGAVFRLVPAGTGAREGARQGSILQYEGQGLIAGALARLDSRFAEGVARSLINQGLESLDRRLQETEPVPAANVARGGPVQWFVAAGRFIMQLVARVRAWRGQRTGGPAKQEEEHVTDHDLG
jgi:carbon monoxide dehydrogenase subunit G